MQILLRSIAHWRARQATRRLLDADDHILADIGLSRCDVALALNLPVGDDPTMLLAKWSDERREALQDQQRRLSAAHRPRNGASTSAAHSDETRHSELPQPVLLVPGLGGSGPTHWQSDWHNTFEHMHRVQQANWDAPDLDQWVAQLAHDVERLPGVVLVAHSLAVSLVAHFVQRFPKAAVSGALLVSPADVDSPARTPEEVRGFAPIPLMRMPFPTLVVASDNDPFVDLSRARAFASAWGARFVAIGPCGHINPDSGFGPWPQGFAFLAELGRAIDQVRQAPACSDSLEPLAVPPAALPLRRQ